MELIDAIDSGDASLVSEVLGRSSLQELYGPVSEKSPLLHAIKEGRIDIVDIFVQKRIELDQPQLIQKVLNSFSQPPQYKVKRVYPLQAAVDTQNTEMVSYLLKNGSKVNNCDGGPDRIMDLAVSQNSTDLASLVVQQVYEISEYHGYVGPTNKIEFGQHLQTAILLHNITMVNVLIRLGADINHPHNNIIPLVLAAQKGDMRMCLALLNAGALVNEVARTGLGNMNTPLGMAIAAGMYKAIQRLLQMGADKNGVTEGTLTESGRQLMPKSSMLHLSCFKKRKEIVEILLESGAKIDSVDAQGNTILHVICNDPQHNEDVKLLQFVLFWQVGNDCELNIDARNKEGMTALMYAAMHGNLKGVEMLLVKGADVQKKNSKKQCALYFAIENGSDRIVDILVQAGSVLNGCKSLAPLHQCMLNGDITLAEIIINAGASVTEVDSKIQTCLHAAVLSKSVDAVEFCLEKNVPVDCQSSTGDTPLMLAARSDCTDLVELLLHKGAKMDIQDKSQKETALSLSVYFGFEQNSFLLIQHGADVNKADKRHTSPLYWAVFNCRVQTLQYLIFADADFSSRILASFPQNLSLMRNKQIYDWLQIQASLVPSLQRCCRKVIRRHMSFCTGGSSILHSSHQLPLPVRLKDFVMLRNESVQKFQI